MRSAAYSLVLPHHRGPIGRSLRLLPVQARAAMESGSRPVHCDEDRGLGKVSLLKRESRMSSAD